MLETSVLLLNILSNMVVSYITDSLLISFFSFFFLINPMWKQHHNCFKNCVLLFLFYQMPDFSNCKLESNLSISSYFYVPVIMNMSASLSQGNVG